jgi:hypothetical protein
MRAQPPQYITFIGYFTPFCGPFGSDLTAVSLIFISILRPINLNKN